MIDSFSYILRLNFFFKEILVMSLGTPTDNMCQGEKTNNNKIKILSEQ